MAMLGVAMPWDIRQINPFLTSFTQPEGSSCKISEADAIHEDRQISFTVVAVTPEDYQTLYQQFEFHPEFGFAQHHGVFMTEMGYYCSLSVDEGTEREVLLRFLNELIQFEPQLQEVLSGIKKSLNYVDRETAYGALMQKFERENFIFVLLAARKLYKQGHRDIFHVLASRCFEVGREREGILALHLIPVDDVLGNFRAAEMFRGMAEHG